MSDPIRRRVIESFGIVGAAQLLIRIRGVLLIPILARGLGAHDYGVWVLVVSTISLASIVTMLGMPQALERFLAGTTRRDEQREDFLSSLVLAGLATGLVALAAAAGAPAWARSAFHQPALAPLIRVGAWVLLATALNQVVLMYFRSQREMRTLSAFDLLTGLGELLLSALAVGAGYGLYGAVLALLVARGVTTAAAFLLIIARIGFAPPRLRHMRAYLAFGVPTLLMGLMYWIVETSDRYFVGYYSTPAQVGIYSAAYALGGVLVFLRLPFMLVLPPFIYQFWDQEHPQRAARYLEASLRSFLIVAVPMSFGISILAHPVLTVLATREFAAAGSPVVPIIVAAMFCYGLSGITGLVFWLQKKPREVTLLWVIAAACNPLLNVALIPRLGIVGAAVATLVSYAIPTVPCTIAYLRLVGRGPNLSFLAATVIGSFLMAALVWLIHPSGMGGLVLAAGLGACAYLGVLILMGGRRFLSFGGGAGATQASAGEGSR